MTNTNKHVVTRRAVCLQPSPEPQPRLARGTRDNLKPLCVVPDQPLGHMWMVDLRVETFARNVVWAASLEVARRLGTLGK